MRKTCSKCVHSEKAFGERPCFRCRDADGNWLLWTPRGCLAIGDEKSYEKNLRFNLTPDEMTIFADLCRRAFGDLMERKVAACPEGCLVVVWEEQHEEGMLCNVCIRWHDSPSTNLWHWTPYYNLYVYDEFELQSYGQSYPKSPLRSL